MGKLVLGRLSSVIDAYSRSDLERALAVWSQDDEVDEHYNSLFRELLTYMMGDPRIDHRLRPYAVRGQEPRSGSATTPPTSPRSSTTRSPARR